MDKKTTLKELEDFELELKEKYNKLVDTNKILSDLNDHIFKIAQHTVDSANETTSYDEKVSSLVKGIQSITTSISDVRMQIANATQKHMSDLQLLRDLKSRFSDYEIMEKKISIPKEQS